jgi:hypothetical protein
VPTKGVVNVFDVQKSKVIRIQGDKLCEMLGLPPKTKIELNVIKEIADAPVKSFVVYNGKNYVVDPSMKAIAGVLLAKIMGE